MAKKDAQVSVLVTQEQKAKWQAEADKRGKSLPEFVRHCVETYIMLMKKVPKRTE